MLAMVASLAPGSPPAQHADAHGCCTTDESGSTPANTPKNDCCRGGQCALQCCRIIPATIDSLPPVVVTDHVIETAAVRPIPFHSLIDPEAIFHPPKV